MKKMMILLVSMAVIVSLCGCGNIKYYPTSVLELSVGGTDDSTYAFESGTFWTTGFSYSDPDNASFNTGVTPVISTDRSYKGSSSLKLYSVFTGATPNMGGILKYVFSAPYRDFTGKKLTAYIWMPASAFTSELAYGGSFYIKTGTAWQWYQSSWVNLNLPGGSAATGVWTKVESYASAFTKPDSTLITAADLMDVREFGIKLGQGGKPDPQPHSPNYTGYIYIDSITIE